MSQPPSAESIIEGPVPTALSWRIIDEGKINQKSIDAIGRIHETIRPFIETFDQIQPMESFSVTIQGIEIPIPKHPVPIGIGFPEFNIFNFGVLSSEELSGLEESVNEFNSTAPGLRASLTSSLKLADAWCPKDAGSSHLGTSSLAGAQLGVQSASCAHARGDKVFAVIVDQGIDAGVLCERVPGARFGGGWRVRRARPGGGTPPDPDDWVEPGTWPDGHGTCMAEAVLSVAPEATILDLPLLPPRIRNLRGFLPWAAWVYWSLSWVIPAVRRHYPDWSWVICNAWSVYDLRHDFPAGSPWNYGENPRSVLNRLVGEVTRNRLADVVFAAGNGGQFCPDPRCGPGQIGPGRSIYGVSALKEVLTVGAVRNDQTWLGYSAQGPSPCDFHSVKPDLVAPSQFTAMDDAARGYSGTSAACALATGAFAAARSLPHNKKLTPAEMLARAVATARPLGAGPVDPSRIGAGMLNIPGLLALP